MSPEAERYDAKVTVLIESVRHHVEEEEQDMFPRVRKALSREQLSELGDLIERAKKVAPTRPHPKAPDEPPGNAIVPSSRRTTSTATSPPRTVSTTASTASAAGASYPSLFVAVHMSFWAK